jgi:tetratricopeptide (TPR) repeat protein
MNQASPAIPETSISRTVNAHTMPAYSEAIPSELLDLDAHWQPLQPAASESLFRVLLPRASELTGNNRSHYIELLTQIARAEAAQQKIREARATLDQAEKLLEDEPASYRVSAKIRWLIETGRICIQEKTLAPARKLFAQAWTLASNSGEDFFTVDVARMMAVIVPPKEQEDWILRGIEIAEKSPQEKAKRWLPSLFASLAWKSFDLRQYDKSLELFQKSLSHFKRGGTERELFVAKWSIGRVLRQMNKLEEAYEIQKSLLAELGVNGRPDGRLFEELAECLYALKETAEAQPYFELAHRELSSDQWVADNFPVKLKRLKDLGKP